ncbi:MAG TPA: Co2+/Mg2+ efflux protein ApaG [Myxococcota bacterium]|nr:Co2+/Mg2+ efflux protein ApaG [Myxococcota bacterium]
MRPAEDSLNDSEAVTRGIRVAVRSRYVAERSRPMMNEFFFAYTIRISNEGRETVQLVSRAWLIEDAEGHVEEVRGPGVVGEQPVLGPGEAFEYTSACPLTTPFGSMRGTYQMVTANGERFEAEIARFRLAEPHSLH